MFGEIQGQDKVEGGTRRSGNPESERERNRKIKRGGKWGDGENMSTVKVENGKGFQREVDSLYVNVAVKAFLFIKITCKAWTPNL